MGFGPWRFESSRPHLVGEAVEAEEADVVARSAVGRQVGEDLADDRAELEAVAGEAGPDDDVRRLGMEVDEEVLVG